MKIRTDFVTNSSSSSYVVCHIENAVLARLYRESGFYKPIKGIVNFRFSSDTNTSLIGPQGGSIAEWLLRMIDRETRYTLYEEEYASLRKSIEENKDAVDNDTKSAEFFTVHIDSESEGSGFISEERKNGRIITTSLQHNDWDCDKEGEPIWEFLSGDEREIRARVKKMKGSKVSNDPWYQEEDLSVTFSPVGSAGKNEDKTTKKSLNGCVCCLTGDFSYGSKDEVEKYINKLGGTCSSSVTKKTNMLIIGELGSAAYAHGSYGSKYIKAKQMLDNGADMTIIREKDFFSEYKTAAEFGDHPNGKEHGPGPMTENPDPIEKAKKEFDTLKSRYEGNPFGGTIPELRKANPDVNMSLIRLYRSRIASDQTDDEFLAGEGILLPVEIMQRKLQEITDELKKRYPEEKPFTGSVSRMQAANEDLPVSGMEKWTRYLHHMSAEEYLMRTGIMKKMERANKPADKAPEEKLESIISVLKERYIGTGKQVHNMYELKLMNKDLPIASLKKLIREVYNRPCDEYLLELGILSLYDWQIEERKAKENE